MPAAGVTLEGPIIKDKLSYLVSARRSWLDFFDNLFSEDNRMNHSTYDYNAKLSYNLSPKSTLRLMAYGAQDGYHLPYDESGDKQTILRFLNPLPADQFRTDRQPTIDWTQAIPIGKISEKTGCYCFAWACITSQAIRLKKKF